MTPHPVRSAAAAATITFAALAGCASQPTTGPPEPETTTTTADVRPEPVTTRTTEQETTTTTTTAPPLTDYETGVLVVALTMCDEVGFDPNGIDWCSVDPDSPELADMVTSGCDLIDAIDPYGTMTNDEIISMHAVLAVDAVSRGAATYDEVSTMSTMNGAILAVRAEVC